MLRQNTKLTAEHSKPETSVSTTYEKFVLIVAIAYLSSIVIEGPLRYALSKLKLESFLYLRDLFAFIVVAIAARKASTKLNTYQKLIAAAPYLLLIHLVIGLWLGRPLIPAFFAYKLFLATLFGIAAAPIIIKSQARIPNILLAFFFITVAGVIINSQITQFPWEGEDFESAFGVARTTIVWWSDGARRISGFTRASFTAAAIIGISGAFSMLHYKNFVLKIGILSLGVGAIYLTTSKGVLVAYAIVGAISLIPASAAFKLNTTRTLIIFFAALTLIAPFIAAFLQISPTYIRTSPASLSSFADRFAITWPGMLNSHTPWHTWIIGTGLGGVSGALRFGSEFYKYNPVDNLFLYIFANFGILGLIYYGTLVFAFISTTSKINSLHKGLSGVALVIFCYGTTAHLLEDAFASIVIGTLLTWGLYNRENRTQANPNSTPDYHSTQISPLPQQHT